MSCCEDCRCKEYEEKIERLLAENAELAAHLEVVTALHDRAKEAERELGKQLVNARGYLRKEGDR